MSVEEYLELLEATRQTKAAVKNVVATTKKTAKTVKKTKRKLNSAYSKAFAKVKGQYMKKSGGWKKGGFARAVKAAHRMAKK